MEDCAMKKKLNPLGLLSILSIIAVLGIITGNMGWFGFLGFLYYLRYFGVVPDEAFKANVERSTALAFFTQLISLVPLLFIVGPVMKNDNYIPVSFGCAFSLGIFVFTLAIAWFEWAESKGMNND